MKKVDFINKLIKKVIDPSAHMGSHNSILGGTSEFRGTLYADRIVGGLSIKVKFFTDKEYAEEFAKKMYDACIEVLPSCEASWDVYGKGYYTVRLIVHTREI